MERVFELIQSAGDGAFAIDRLQHIVVWNDACEQMLGYSASEVVGKRCYDVLGGTAEDGCSVCLHHCDAMRKRTAHEPIRSSRLAVRHRDGTHMWVTISSIPVPSTWSELSVLVHLLTDVTLHKRIESLVSDLVGEVARLSQQPPRSDAVQLAREILTQRELQILKKLSTGKTTSEIAGDLSISPATARNHTHHILNKLGVRNRLEAVTLGLRTGLL